MKEKQMACIVIALLIAIVGYGMQKMRSELNSIRKEAGDAESKAKASEFQRGESEKKLTDLKQKSSGLREYFEKWLPYMASTWNTEQEEQRIIELIKSGQVFATSQRTQILGQKSKSGFIQKRLRAHLKIQDEYIKTMNWLGHLEESMPTSRISTYRISKGGGGNDINIEVLMDVPLIQTGQGNENS